MSDFKTELQELLNKHCRENQSNTPDFILAQYVDDCLRAFESAQIARVIWLELNNKAK